jgi:hypothetical protein
VKRRIHRDAVALVLALGAAIAVVVIALGAALHEGPISQEESTLLSTALGAAIGAIATYLGISRTRGDSEDAPLPPGGSPQALQEPRTDNRGGRD